MDDATLLTRFEAGHLTEFPHLEHVQVVFARTRQTDKDEAIRFVRRGLRALTERLGDPGKYHETLTVAWASLVGTLTQNSDAPTFAAFLQAHPEVTRSTLMSDYYSRDLLLTDQARAAFVDPDLRPLPRSIRAVHPPPAQ